MYAAHARCVCGWLSSCRHEHKHVTSNYAGTYSKACAQSWTFAVLCVTLLTGCWWTYCQLSICISLFMQCTVCFVCVSSAPHDGWYIIQLLCGWRLTPEFEGKRGSFVGWYLLCDLYPSSQPVVLYALHPFVWRLRICLAYVWLAHTRFLAQCC